MTEHIQGWPEIPDKKYFKIGEVADIIGVKPYILRYWESEFRVISPKKTSGRHRMYNRRDIEILATIKTLLYEQMYTIAGAQKRLQELCMQEDGPITPLLDDEDPLHGALDGTGQAALEQEVEQLRAANQQLTARLEKAEQANRTAEAAMADLRAAHQEALTRADELERQLARSRRENPADAQLRKEHSRLQDRATTLEAELTALKAERDDLLKAIKVERENVLAARKAHPDRKVAAAKEPADVDRAWLDDLDQAHKTEANLRHELKDQLIHHRLFLKRLRSEIAALMEFAEEG